MLYIVATPIGNLEDITMRALRILGEVDAVVCEDTRQTAKLLMHFDIRTSCIAFHAHSTKKDVEKLVRMMQEGKQLAYVTDAGTPGISDPGHMLSRACVQAHIPVVPIPGASAFLTALMASGVPIQEFVYSGFPPAKKGRTSFFSQLPLEKRTQVFYESKHRLANALELLVAHVPDRSILVAKELTKSHEQFFRGLPSAVRASFSEEHLFKGEFVIIVAAEGFSFDDDAVVKEKRQKRDKYLDKKQKRI
ncbi:16S rRNA (cytidine(1402)-2'-O)-methyltransferase [Candidatus Gracilibacteria bacterium CG17_big_fil_post_rev_8_21_14_2_50_48_13]|nr:MAG: 16S rRNA (cytidine(1402)-2'-O)-methyltransferase [Candidatus Gracilibacteria bacterium CG17_big_fil_post_rev_8_21_14_2_50_48_13]